jgi:hypothetical protein
MNPQLLTYLIIKYGDEPLDKVQLRNLIKDLRTCGNTDKQVDAIISEHFKTKDNQNVKR